MNLCPWSLALASSLLSSTPPLLNTLEVFAYAHDKPGKLSGQLLLDTAGRLPVILKCRYLDYLDKLELDMSQPGFESLRKVIVLEIAMMASEYAHAFSKQDEKEGPRDSGTTSKDFQVRQVGINVDNRDRDQGSFGTTSDTPRTSLRKTRVLKPSNGANDKSKPPSVCFVCSTPDSKHFLMDCEIFMDLSPKWIFHLKLPFFRSYRA